MDNFVSFYSKYNYSKQEIIINRNRTIFAIILALIIHIVLLFFIGSNFLQISKPKDEIKIINVQLLESVQKQTTLTSKQTTPSEKKENVDKKQETQQPNSIQQKTAKQETIQQKQIETPTTQQQIEHSNQIQEKTETIQQENIENVTEIPTPTETQTTVKPKEKKQSAFDKFAQAQDNSVADNQKQWEQNKAKNNTDNNEQDFEQTINEINNIKATSTENNTNSENSQQTEETTTQSGADNGDIIWNGSARHLKSVGGIKAPDDISELGIKTSITLQFEVYTNGLIGEVKIIESSGETEWDNYIVDQFKANYKFDTAEKNATGIIQIQIGL